MVRYEAQLDDYYAGLLLKEAELNDSIIAHNDETLRRLAEYHVGEAHEGPLVISGYLAAYQDPADAHEAARNGNEVFGEDSNGAKPPNEVEAENEQYANLLKKHINQFMI